MYKYCSKMVRIGGLERLLHGTGETVTINVASMDNRCVGMMVLVA